MSKTVEVANASVSYQIDGQGPALLLISGTGGDIHSNWDHLIHQFTTQHTVLRADYAGSGQTRDNGEPLHIETLAEQIMATAKAENLSHFDLVGYSLGSCIAIYIAAHYLELPSGHLAPFECPDHFVQATLAFIDAKKAENPNR